MVKVCLQVILAPVSHISPRANMTYRCQYDLEAHLDHTITSNYFTIYLCAHTVVATV